MKSVLILALAVMLSSANAQTQAWCKPEVFIDSANNYRQNPGLLATYIETRILQPLNCNTKQIANGSEGNSVGLSVSEGCGRVA